MPLINVRERKRELRARFRRYRADCPPELKCQLDEKLTQRFLALDEYKSCDTLFAYISRGIECDTSKIIAQAFADGKRVAVPKCREKSNEMDFYYIKSYDDLKSGKYGILEPDPELCEPVTVFSQGLCLVPGLCYDLQGYRLGFGGGYYDRFLNIFEGITAGICYSKCTMNELPRGAFDKATDILVTEKFVNYR